MRFRTFFEVGPFVLLLVFVLVIGVSLLLSGEPRQVERPCHEQAPAHCRAHTVETSTTQNFHSYVYCACVTQKGRALGYVAARRALLDSVRGEKVIQRGGVEHAQGL